VRFFGCVGWRGKHMCRTSFKSIACGWTPLARCAQELETTPE
jgi:hypothetical protein